MKELNHLKNEYLFTELKENATFIKYFGLMYIDFGGILPIVVQ